MRRLPPLNTLRVFDAAARQSSFSAAAQELCVTHSAVSHQIRSLEDWLGQSLFVRQATGVRLTPAGLSLHQATDQALTLLQNRCSEVAGTAKVTEIVLGAPGSFLANWLIPRLDRFETTHPGIQLRLQTSAAISDLQTQSVDALILSGRSWPRQIATTALFEEKIGPVWAPDEMHGINSAADLLGRPLLHTKSYLQAWPEWASAQGLDPAGFRGGRQFDHLPLMLEAAVAKLGIAIAPELLVEREISRNRLTAPLGFVPCGAVVAFCTMRDRQDEAVTAVRDWLKTEADGSGFARLHCGGKVPATRTA